MAEACRKIDADFREGAARLLRETGRPVRGHRVRRRRGQTPPRLDAGRGLAPGARFSLSEHRDAELAYGMTRIRYKEISTLPGDCRWHSSAAATRLGESGVAHHALFTHQAEYVSGFVEAD